MTKNKKATPGVDKELAYIKGVAKNLVDRLYGPAGLPWGTTFTEPDQLLSVVSDAAVFGHLPDGTRRALVTALPRLLAARGGTTGPGIGMPDLADVHVELMGRDQNRQDPSIRHGCSSMPMHRHCRCDMRVPPRKHKLIRGELRASCCTGAQGDRRGRRASSRWIKMSRFPHRSANARPT